jgi:hypothetical protein
MVRERYFVVLDDGEWKINFQGNDYGPYLSQQAAIRAAVDAAHKSGSSGHDAQVIVQGSDHEFRTEWTYGHDPYPPAGWTRMLR